MKSCQLQKIKSLRTLVPVGIRHAQNLLEKNSGNVEAAAEMFKDDRIHLLASSSDLPVELARKYLRGANYEMHLALQAIDNDRFTLSERILNKNHQNKNRAVGLIADAIEATEGLVRNYWLSFDDIERLVAELRCFMVIYEWVNFEEWEGLDSALYFHLKSVIEQLNFLKLAVLARHLQSVHQRQLELIELHSDKDRIAVSAIIQQDEIFSVYSVFYYEHKHMIDDALYRLAQENVVKFPK